LPKSAAGDFATTATDSAQSLIKTRFAEKPRDGPSKSAVFRTRTFCRLTGQRTTHPGVGSKFPPAGGCRLHSSDVGLVRWRCFVIWRTCVTVNSERVNAGIARARNQRHHH
jgi:hypothetical protein